MYITTTTTTTITITNDDIIDLSASTRYIEDIDIYILTHHYYRRLNVVGRVFTVTAICIA